MKTPTTLLQTREALGMSQQAFARLLNISRSQLAMAETGRRQLSSVASGLLLQIQQEMDREESSLLSVAGTQLPVASYRLPEAGNRLPFDGDPRFAHLAGRCRQEAIRCRRMARHLQKSQLIEARRKQVDPLMARLSEERSLPPSPSSQRRHQPQNNKLPHPALPDRLLEAARHFEAIAALLEH